MTRDEQTTERALVHAQADWLRARGWREVGHRWGHESAPTNAPALSLADAMAFSRAEPLRYRRAR